MTTDTLTQARNAISQAAWNLDFEAFQRVTGFSGEYAIQKFRELNELAQAFNRFDDKTLAAIVGAQ